MKLLKMLETVYILCNYNCDISDINITRGSHYSLSYSKTRMANSVCGDISGHILSIFSQSV